jgi:two-component system sensor histidine kinase KdpD
LNEAQLEFVSSACTDDAHLHKWKGLDFLTGFSIPSRAAIGAQRPRSTVRLFYRYLPEWSAAAAAVPLTAALAFGLRWPWAPAVLAGLLIPSVGVALYRLSTRATRAAREAESATVRMRWLYELTHRTLDMDLHVEPGARLAALVHEIFDLDAVAVFDADLQEVYKAGYWSVDPSELAQNVYHFGTSDDDRATGISRRVVRLGSVPVGSLVIRGETSPLINSGIAALIAITFDRYRALANETRIETERQAEQLRTTVLDNLAHDYKTPLTAIRAASSGLSEMGGLTEGQSELVALIDEQAALLADLTTRLLTTARPDAGDSEDGSPGLMLRTAPEDVGLLIEEAVASLADRSAETRIQIKTADDSLVLDCDRRLVGMLLAQYLDNACKYAEFDSTITVGAERAGEEVLLSVHSFGPVIPMADRERIFDRYYRSSASSSHAPGTGIGLSIAKRAALAHGGSVWVSSDETDGTIFFAALPVRSPQLAASSRDELLSAGTPAFHPTDEDFSAGPPALERSMS